MEKFFFCCKGKVLHGQRCLFFPVIPEAAAQVGLQKRLLSFLPDLSHLESLRGSSHTPTEGKKVNSLPGCFSDRGMDALGGQGGIVSLPALLPMLFLVAQHLPGSRCHSKPMRVARMSPRAPTSGASPGELIIKQIITKSKILILRGLLTSQVQKMFLF